MAPDAVDAADLSLRAGEGETLEIWPETQETIWLRQTTLSQHDYRLGLTDRRSLLWASGQVYVTLGYFKNSNVNSQPLRH